MSERKGNERGEKTTTRFLHYRMMDWIIGVCVRVYVVCKVTRLENEEEEEAWSFTFTRCVRIKKDGGKRERERESEWIVVGDIRRNNNHRAPRSWNDPEAKVLVERENQPLVCPTDSLKNITNHSRSPVRLFGKRKPVETNQNGRLTWRPLIGNVIHNFERATATTSFVDCFDTFTWQKVFCCWYSILRLHEMTIHWHRNQLERHTHTHKHSSFRLVGILPPYTLTPGKNFAKTLVVCVCAGLLHDWKCRSRPRSALSRLSHAVEAGATLPKTFSAQATTYFPLLSVWRPICYRDTQARAHTCDSTHSQSVSFSGYSILGRTKLTSGNDAFLYPGDVPLIGMTLTNSWGVGGPHFLPPPSFFVAFRHTTVCKMGSFPLRKTKATVGAI